MEKNVIVNDCTGKTIGSTYLRRAKGLVKKNRAEWVDDLQNAVILTCSPDITEEDILMENTVDNAVNTNTNTDTDILFDAREWSFNPDTCKTNQGERCFIECGGELVEAFCIGNWNWDWTSIISKPYALRKNTEYRFTFWLNGGENDRNDEVCRFQVIFDEDWDSARIYKLNRSFIKPKKHVDGWYLYEIPFRTGENDITRLAFAAMRAYMAVRPAKPLREYSLLKSEPVPEGKPQRHNIIFEDGWPKEKPQNGPNGGGFGRDSRAAANNRRIIPDGIDFDEIAEEFSDNLRQGILDEIDFGKIADEVTDSLKDVLSDEIDFGEIADEVTDSLKDVLSDDLVRQIKSILGKSNS